jgi:thioredoxin reductase (NADPH)
MAGVFAAGDLRAGSTKQLASSIGEGAAVLLAVRQYLQKLGDEPAKEAAA